MTDHDRQLDKGFTQIANDILSDLARLDATGAQHRLIQAVLRETYGRCEEEPDGSVKLDTQGNPVKKKWAAISTYKFQDLTGLSRTTVIESLPELVERNILQTLPGSGRKPAQWTYQKYSHLWKPKAVRTPRPQNPFIVHPAVLQNTETDHSGVPEKSSGTDGCTTNGEFIVHPYRPPLNKDLNKGVCGETPAGKELENGEAPSEQGKVAPPSWEELIARYSPEDQVIITEYWNTIRTQTRTRQVLAETLKRRWMYAWSKYPTDIVIEGLQTHIDDYPKKRENYTNGIIANIQYRKEEIKEGKPQRKRKAKPKRKSTNGDKYKLLNRHYFISDGEENEPFPLLEETDENRKKRLNELIHG